MLNPVRLLDGSNWQPSEVLPLSSGIVSVPAGAGITAGIAITRALSAALPHGARVLVRSMTIAVLNGPSNQILLNLGATNSHPRWTQRNASSFAQLGPIPTNLVLDPPGPLFVDISNISGTTFTGAQGAGISIDVVISLDAVLLIEANREQVQHR